MDHKEVKKLVYNIVQNEYYHYIENMGNDMPRNENIQDHLDAEAKETKLAIEIRKLLPEDKQYLIDDYYDDIRNTWSFEIGHFFHKGVRAGLTNLKFLNDIPDVNNML